ncbi:MAG: DUF3999 family protein [Rhizobacter sp.]
MRRELMWALLACALPAWAGEAPLTLEGQAPYHGLTIPLPVLAQTRHADLSDIRVLNARGEPVPHAWVDEPVPASAEQRQHKVPFYQAPAAASAVTASQQGGWIVDLRKVPGALLELRLEVPADAHGVYDFAIEASDDLQQWRTYTSSSQLLSLQHQGLRLEHTAFDLAGLSTRYLRLRTRTGSQPPPLSGVQVTSITRHAAVSPLQWSEPLAPTQCTAEHCDYTVPRHLPLDRLEWQLADANTLVPVDLYVRYEPGITAPTARHEHRQRLRDRLRGIRQKDAPPAAADAANAWVLLTRTTAYWLRLPDGEVRSQPLRLDAGVVTQLRVQPRGGVSQLGSRPPTVRIGAPAARLVFLAREPAPYRLAWGGDAAAAMSLAQLMPTRKPDDALPADTASVVLAAVAPPFAAVASAAPASAATAPPTPSRKLWLWGVLLAALSIMGVMAWLLLRPAKKT